MFFDYFQKMAAKARQTANSEEAKVIKKKLIKTGTILAIIGFGGVFTCFILFALNSIRSVNDHEFGFSPAILIPFFLFVPFGFVGGMGASAVSLGLRIVIAEKATDFFDQNAYCPNCGDVVTSGEKYCDKCGHALLVDKVCSVCNTENDMDSKFCKNCGNEL